MIIRHLSRIPVTFGLLLISLPTVAQGIVDSKHNLTQSGPGMIKARPRNQEELCIFCHTPHQVRGKPRPVLFGWNRAESNATYTTYESSTMYATVGQPTGASKLCLSCHDGTIALGSILSQPNPIPFQGDWENSPANLGTNLSDDHPISFKYDSALAAANGELVDPSTLTGNIKLDSANEVQCTSCHDAHDDSNGMFLVVADPVRELCIACHEPRRWSLSSHANSKATWDGQGVDPWPHTDEVGVTVADNVCQNCHQPHNAGKPQGLLSYFVEEANCLKCHDGSIAAEDIEQETGKLYAHRVQDYTGVHDAGEPPSDAGSPPHVECVDCHNPHRATSQASTPPDVPGSLQGVDGVDLTGMGIAEASYTYQICFKCHADNNVIDSVNITRQIPQINTRLEFVETALSAHPVTNRGFNQNVPSMLPPYDQPGNMISCTDCHGSDDGATTGGNGPDGPHGSVFEYLLVRNYNTIDGTPESSSTYALCYGCHDRFSILNDESFGEHDKHVRGENTPCSVCHDPHGISDTQGDATNHQFLINFDVNVVSPTSLGELRWEEGSFGPGSSRCYLACHGVEHDGWEDR